MSTYLKDSCIACSNLELNCTHIKWSFHTYNAIRSKKIFEELSTFQDLLDIKIGEPQLLDEQKKVQDVNQELESDQENQYEQFNIQEEKKAQNPINILQDEINKNLEEADVKNQVMIEDSQNQLTRRQSQPRVGAKMKKSTKLKRFYPKLKSQIIQKEKDHKQLPKSIKNENIGNVIQLYRNTVHIYLNKLSKYIPLPKRPPTNAQRQQQDIKIAFKKKAKQLLDQYWEN